MGNIGNIKHYLQKTFQKLSSNMPKHTEVLYLWMSGSAATSAFICSLAATVVNFVWKMSHTVRQGIKKICKNVSNFRNHSGRGVWRKALSIPDTTKDAVF